MPRPTSEGAAPVQPGGFAPSSMQNIGLQVTAPLDVNAAPTQASALAKALGVAWEQAEPAVLKHIRNQAQSEAAKGEADAALGNVDPEMARKSEAYGVGAHRVVVEQQTLSALNDARQLAETEWATLPAHDFNSAGNGAINSNQGLIGKIDDYLRSRLNGLDKDPAAAKVMAPMIQNFMKEQFAQRTEQTIRNTQQASIDTTAAMAVHAMASNDGSFDTKEQLQKLVNANFGNQRAGRDALVEAVATATIMGRNPNIADKFLPEGTDFGNGATLTPENIMKLQAAKQHAQGLYKQDQERAVKGAEDQISDMMLSNKDPLDAIHAYLKVPGASADFALHAYDWFYRRGKEREMDSVENNHITWDMDRGVSSGEITNSGQLLKYLSDSGVGNSKAGNMMFNRGMQALRANQNTMVDDPDYRAAYSNLASLYKPATNPVTGKFLNDAANSQQAGLLADFRTEYNQAVRGGQSSTEAARTAAEAAKKKWGDPVESSNGTLKSNAPQPKSDVDQAAVIRDAPKSPAAFHASGITMQDVMRLSSTGLISPEQGELAARLIIAKHSQ